MKSLIASFLLLVSLSAFAEDIIGSWEQRTGTLKASYTIVHDGLKYFEVYEDGSRMELIVVEPKNGEKMRFLNSNSKFGDGAAILDSGLLRLFDNEGIIEDIKPK